MKINYFFNTLVLFLFIAIFAALEPAQAGLVGNTNNATITFSSLTGIARVNSPFNLDITVDTHGQNVVAVAAYISYNPSIIEVTGINTSASAFTMEAENSIDPINGRIKITRGLPSPGVNSVNAKLVTLSIQGKANYVPSSDNLTFDFVAGSTSDSNVVLDDGLGTDILSGVYNARFSFDGTPPANVTGLSATPGSGQITLSWTNPTSDFNGVKILRKTNSFPTGPSDGTMVYDSNGTSYVDSGLNMGVTYYYTAYSRDVVLNYSSGANISSTLLDISTPSAISNLAVSATVSKTATLTWTAVGDDGNVGTAASYNIRYSTSNITTANWSSATLVANRPTPKASGSSESFIISGLGGGIIYYFGVRALDASGYAE